MSTSVKILPIQEEKIDKIIQDKDLRYNNKNDFVKKAVDNELRLATLKHVFSENGKYHFELLYNEALYRVYERSLVFDGKKNTFPPLDYKNEDLDILTHKRKK